MQRPEIDQQITFLNTKDLGTTTDFYKRTLGLPVVLDQFDCRIFQVSEDGYIGFCLREEIRPKGGIILTFVTNDVDQWYEHLKGKSIEIEKAPAVNTRYQIYHFFFWDPNGYILEVQKFLDPKWAALKD